MTNIFGLHTQPCKTTRYTMKLILMLGGGGGGGEEKEPASLLADEFQLNSKVHTWISAGADLGFSREGSSQKLSKILSTFF